MMRSALLKASLLFSMPIFSMVSSVFLIPAVSVRITGMPPMESPSSITSLVVPGIAVTMALLSLRSAFMRDDFPTLGLPMMDILRPSLIILPVSAVSRSPAISEQSDSSPF